MEFILSEANGSLTASFGNFGEQMEKEGFWRTIQLQGDTTVYHLPTAEYNYSGNIDTSDVLDLAKKAASRTGKTLVFW